MNSKNTAANIATWMRDTDEHLTAWIKIIGRKFGQSQLAILRNDVEAEIALVRGGRTYSEYLAQYQRELEDARDENTLIALLDSLGSGKADTGPY